MMFESGILKLLSFGFSLLCICSWAPLSLSPLSIHVCLSSESAMYQAMEILFICSVCICAESTYKASEKV